MGTDLGSSGRQVGSRQWIGASLLAGLTVGLVTLFQNCGGSGFKAAILTGATNSSSSQGEGSGNGGGGGVIKVPGTVSLSQPTSVSLNLGTRTTFPVAVKADANYNGMVTLALRRSDLASADPSQLISASFDQASLALAQNGSATVNVTLSIPTMAPSFASRSIHLDAIDLATGATTASTTLPLEVKAIYDVHLHGPVTSPESWSIGPGAASVKFTSHSEGLLVRFNNMDSSVHLIHSSGGPIPHESTTAKYPGTNIIGLPPSADAGTSPGGIYMVTVAPGSSPVSSQVYCHNHETTAQSRTLEFNVAPPAPPTLGNPNATFTVVNNMIIQPKCVSCHTVGNAQGGVDLSTYQKVLGYVTKGNPLASSFYTSLAPGGNMPPANPASTSAALVQDVRDWITSNAPNN